VNLQSRVGVADVRIEGVAPPARISIQVGPVLRGTAVRDALEFVAFTEFANQSDFAAVANGLNDRVLTVVLAPLDLQSLQGRTISFVGACAIGVWRPDMTLDVVPVRLRVGGGAQ